MALRNAYTIPQLRAWLNYANYTPTNGFITAITTLINTIISNGDWTTTDCIYIFAGENSSASLISIKNPSSFPALNSSGSFSANLGITTNGTNQYINTQYYPFYNINFARNDAGMMLYQTQTAPSITGVFCGMGDAGSTNLTYLQPSGGKMFGACNVTSIGTGQVNYGTLAGCWGAKKTSSTNQEVWFNGVKVATETITVNGSAATQNSSLTIGAFNSLGTISSYQAGTYAIFVAGASSIVNLNYYNAIQTFATSRGFNV